ncbi:MAG: leucine-rich repeat protein [Treponema sp.]|jgi:photosystem II stability/assembly factor-like uncharacterized protein|nr:leucine-rich repeat protein [Treponema sp.]
MKTKKLIFVAALIALAAIALFAQEGMVPTPLNPFFGQVGAISVIAPFPKTRTYFVANGEGRNMAQSVLGQWEAGPTAKWERITLPANHFTGAIQGIAGSEETLVVVGNNGKMAYSDDGKTFTAVANSSFGTSHILDVAFGGIRFVAVGAEGKTAFSMDRGRTWTPSTLDPAGMQIEAVAYGNNRFVAVGRNGTSAWSTDGRQWTKVAIFGGDNATDIAFGGGRFVVTGNNGKMAWSTNGAAWTNVADSTFGTSHIMKIAYHENSSYLRFVAVGFNNKIAWSTDNGTTWKQVKSPFSGDVNLTAVGIWAGSATVMIGAANGSMAGLDVTKTWETIATTPAPTTIPPVTTTPPATTTPAQQNNPESDYDINRYSNRVTIMKYKGTNPVVNIPPSIQNLPVTEIGNGAFRDAAITSVTVPTSVTAISAQAFRGCTRLTSVTLPNTLTNINNYLFEGCSNLKSIDIPNSVTTIGTNAFEKSGLTSITIGTGIRTIGNNAFRDSKLEVLTIHAATPPALSNSALLETANNLQIRVPSSAVNAYKAAAGWKDFASRIVAQ